MTIDLRNRTPQALAQKADAPVSGASPREAHRVHSRQRERVVLYGMVACGALIVAIPFYMGASKLTRVLFSDAMTAREVRGLIRDVSGHVLVPENETPTVATVSDMHALEGQEFFKNAQEGDKVLMYMRSQKAIIYRPSIDRIIEVGPITGTDQ